MTQANGKTLTGRCLCGAVKFKLSDEFKGFFQCHCKQCQQLTGSAFASNLFTSPDNLEWLEGERLVSKFEHADREFSKAFCSNCGSALPVVTKTGASLLVPAGSLDKLPAMRPQANIFIAEKAEWLEQGLKAKGFSGFPD